MIFPSLTSQNLTQSRKNMAFPEPISRVHGSVKELWKHDGNRDDLPGWLHRQKIIVTAISGTAPCVMQLMRRLIASGCEWGLLDSRFPCDISAFISACPNFG